MADAIPVHIVLVLDESGSMQPLRDDLIGGVNQFVADQRAQPGKCRLTLVKFAPYTLVHNAVKIAEVPDLTQATYQPRSNTPLLDAEGRALTAAMQRETGRAHAGKTAEAVLFVTYTDGAENASIEWTWDALSAAKKGREETGWTFLYLGAGHDAYGQASRMHTNAANVSSVAATAGGMSASFASASAVATGYRGAASKGDTGLLRAASGDAYGALGVDKADARQLGDAAICRRCNRGVADHRVFHDPPESTAGLTEADFPGVELHGMYCPTRYGPPS